MLKFQYTCAFLILGFLSTVQTFAGSSDPPAGQLAGGVKTHFTLALHYDDLAQTNKSKADN
jgi:hypothetical protein